MSISNEINRLSMAKISIASAIQGKGVTVPSETKLDRMSELIDAIPTGGTEVDLYAANTAPQSANNGDLWVDYSDDVTDPVTIEALSVTTNGTYTAETGHAYSPVTVNVPTEGGQAVAVSSGVNFIDYDGTVLYSWDAGEVSGKSSLPSNPIHEGLTSQGWNWTLSDIKTYIDNYPNSVVWVGQMYITDDGKTRIYIHLEEGRLSPYLGLGVNGSVDIDWGDNTAHGTLTGSSLSTIVSTQHNYADDGDYVITLTVTGNATINGTNTTQIGSRLLWKNISSSYENKCYQNAIWKIEIGSNINVYAYAFQNCYSLTSITIPNTITTIGSYMFDSCYSLTNIVIPNSVTVISTYAFQNCWFLTNASIPNGITTISSGVFAYCRSLTNITIPNSVTAIGTYVFRECYSLENITIPNGVTSVGSNAFSNCRFLTNIIIPNGVTKISSETFYNCSNLTSITISNNATSIDTNAFAFCYSLANIIIPNSATKISSVAFQGCYSLANITIPNGITSIEAQSFVNCYGLGYIKFESATPPTVANVNAWQNIPADCIIYVPSGSLSAYTTATNYPDPATYVYVEY